MLPNQSPPIYTLNTTMRKLFIVAIICLTGFIQSAQAQEKCLTEIMFREAVAKDASVLQNREALEKFTEQYVQNVQNTNNRSSSVVRIIPVVVHIIHYGGPENISDAQVQDQIDSLNKDFRRLNADAANTPAAFAAIGADCQIEFRLAQLDENGNCTTGINRVYSPLTYNARNNVKGLIYWPSNKYLNLWIVNSIANTNGGPGSVIGFAQFPGGAAATDGVVIKHDFFGSIGTATSSGGAGRTATHEIGHWLNLRHIWGDDAGLCSGTDFVNDTPNQADWTLSICPTFPLTDGCTGPPNGIMYPNYMDYTNGDCQNIFTVGQSQRMDAALSSPVSGRNNLYTASNLLATGTDGTPAVLCSPIADFIPRPLNVCEGGSLTFKDLSWGGIGASRVWSFPGGTPSSDTSAIPTILYATAGTYDVSLTVTNASGSDTKTITGMVTVTTTTVGAFSPFSEGFENGNFPFADWSVYNANGGSTWGLTTVAAASGARSIFINNFSNNDKGPDEFLMPAFNLSNVTGTQMTFDVAYAITSATSTNTDKLTVYYSTNCGKTWTVRLTKTGTALATTANPVTINFVPTASQWVNIPVNLAPVTVSTQPNVRFKFEFTHDSGNNIYIDNININGTITGVDDINAEYASVNIYPNPSTSLSYMNFTTAAAGNVKIEVQDVSGRLISTFSDDLPAGDHQYTMENNLESGVYLVRLIFGEKTVTKKIVIQ
ncbi:hypothetical protein BH11BAC2_BH11BAC2_21690 [soil metagenome]